MTQIRHCCNVSWFDHECWSPCCYLCFCHILANCMISLALYLHVSLMPSLSSQFIASCIYFYLELSRAHIALCIPMPTHHWIKFSAVCLNQEHFSSVGCHQCLIMPFISETLIHQGTSFKHADACAHIRSRNLINPHVIFASEPSVRKYFAEFYSLEWAHLSAMWTNTWLRQ